MLVHKQGRKGNCVIIVPYNVQIVVCLSSSNLDKVLQQIVIGKIKRQKDGNGVAGELEQAKETEIREIFNLE